MKLAFILFVIKTSLIIFGLSPGGRCQDETSTTTDTSTTTTTITLPSLPPTWKAQEYFGDVIGENEVGTVVFDATGQCDGTPPIYVSLVFCPLSNAANYFATGGSGNTSIVLAKNYPLSSNLNSPYLPSCTLTCTDGLGRSSNTSLDINIAGRNVNPPVWDQFIPGFYVLPNVAPLQYILTAPATDADVNKMSDGRVTYSVDSIDGAAVTPGSNEYVKFENNGASPRLDVYQQPPWLLYSNHTIILKAQDNPTLGKPNVIQRTLILMVGGELTTTTTAAGTDVSLKTTQPGIPLTITPQGFSFPTSQATTSIATTITAYFYDYNDCPSGNQFVCKKQWIWIIVAIGGALVVGGALTIIILYGINQRKTRHVGAYPSPKSLARPKAMLTKPPAPIYRPAITSVQ